MSDILQWLEGQEALRRSGKRGTVTLDEVNRKALEIAAAKSIYTNFMMTVLLIGYPFALANGRSTSATMGRGAAGLATEGVSAAEPPVIGVRATGGDATKVTATRGAAAGEGAVTEARASAMPAALGAGPAGPKGAGPGEGAVTEARATVVPAAEVGRTGGRTGGIATGDRSTVSVGQGEQAAVLKGPQVASAGGGEAMLRSPARRHWAATVDQGTVAKEVNTVIEPGVDVAADVTAIRSGQAARVKGDFVFQGRTYGVHNGTLFPISGPGFHRLTRPQFKALGVYNEVGNVPRAAEILDKMGIPLTDRVEALRILEIIR
jgi:hypothetical protein